MYQAREIMTVNFLEKSSVRTVKIKLPKTSINFDEGEQQVKNSSPKFNYPSVFLGFLNKKESRQAKVNPITVEDIQESTNKRISAQSKDSHSPVTVIRTTDLISETLENDIGQPLRRASREEYSDDGQLTGIVAHKSDMDNREATSLHLTPSDSNLYAASAIKKTSIESSSPSATPYSKQISRLSLQQRYSLLTSDGSSCDRDDLIDILTLQKQKLEEIENILEVKENRLRLWEEELESRTLAFEAKEATHGMRYSDGGTTEEVTNCTMSSPNFGVTGTKSKSGSAFFSEDSAIQLPTQKEKFYNLETAKVGTYDPTFSWIGGYTNPLTISSEQLNILNENKNLLEKNLFLSKQLECVARLTGGVYNDDDSTFEELKRKLVDLSEQFGKLSKELSEEKWKRFLIEELFLFYENNAGPSIKELVWVIAQLKMKLDQPHP
ncbi:uncharacterized protein KNAG_0A06050 [Huiozyma naganishii CBS 8797]|uniref:Uncharacterized protein n=1 Tax=Huiozyma naganishii (strain ATCC MYA-139 / BCRC 22969 / CBS 8797 / KCTC 17520 / NBRC 10181 / NCYC 3082 / Yp74L-3) TaxID=1071383 RepID=J7RTZ5_HUIN7|nr:hypothetical protein KNAG_0A06050 [Kazachstania naganishii CBS 8797]CCK68267.1 hypothetical protein KNAG_0A06050 [Kazachstania naganishii CBS 8797]